MRRALLFAAAALLLEVGALYAAPAPQTQAVALETVRTQIAAIEKDLLEGRESQLSAAGQLKKIRKLLTLQQKEIQLSKKRVADLSVSLSDLSAQKLELIARVEKEKVALRVKLRELEKLGETDALDAGWLEDLDGQNQKTYFLSTTLGKELASVAHLRDDVEQARNLEFRIMEEKGKLEYYVQELGSQMTLLGANEIVQKEIIRTRRASRLESLRRIRNLRESERELEKMLATFHEQRRVRENAEFVAASAPKSGASYKVPTTKTSAVMKPVPVLQALGGSSLEVVTLAALKGKLPYPAEGRIASGYGKSYNPKTSLLTFQKGITLATPRGAAVHAVSAGKVVFAGPLHNYGLIAIVEHPGQYYTLYGQMGTVAVNEGLTVKQGDLIGKTDGEPLYFEIRSRNVAVNPSQWLKL